MKDYPDIRWEVFVAVNADATHEFENMCRRLFRAEFLENQEIPHSDHNNKGIEVLPILEPVRKDGKQRKWISFQSKYTDSPASAYMLNLSTLRK